MKIVKYTLEITDAEQVIDIPLHRKLTVQLEHNEIVLWAAVKDETPSYPRTLILRTTGDEINEDDIYLGTVQTELVKVTYHLFQICNKGITCRT